MRDIRYNPQPGDFVPDGDRGTLRAVKGRTDDTVTFNLMMASGYYYSGPGGNGIVIPLTQWRQEMGARYDQSA